MERSAFPLVWGRIGPCEALVDPVLGTEGQERLRSARSTSHGIFSGQGASNLVWIYCPNYESIPNEKWNRPFSYYPGNDYVDAIFVDAYEHPERKNERLEKLLEPFFNSMGLFYEAQQAAGTLQLKPFGLGEFDQGGDQIQILSSASR